LLFEVATIYYLFIYLFILFYFILFCCCCCLILVLCFFFAGGILSYAFASANDYYGYSVASSNAGTQTFIVVGAPQNDWRNSLSAPASGYAVIFSCESPNICSVMQVVSDNSTFPTTAQFGDSFGASVAVSGNLIAVSAVGYGTNTHDGAVAHFYCTQLCSLVAVTTNTGSNNYFGSALAIAQVSSNLWLIAAGAMMDSSAAGAFYTYLCTMSSCTAPTRTMPAGVVANDQVLIRLTDFFFFFFYLFVSIYLNFICIDLFVFIYLRLFVFIYLFIFWDLFYFYMGSFLFHRLTTTTTKKFFYRRSDMPSVFHKAW
jgi:hypothetical protein